MTPSRKLRSIFTAAVLTTASVPALAQEQPAASQTTTQVEAPVTPPVMTAPVMTAPAVEPQKVEPLKTVFTLQGRLDTVKRDILFACPDNTQSCWTAAEQDSARARELQMVVMAGALSCQKQPGMEDLLDRYNDFVSNNAKNLSENYFTARGRFYALKGTGKPGNAAMDNFDTALANMYSFSASAHDYCAGISGVVRDAAKLNAANPNPDPAVDPAAAKTANDNLLAFARATLPVSAPVVVPAPVVAAPVVAAPVVSAPVVTAPAADAPVTAAPAAVAPKAPSA